MPLTSQPPIPENRDNLVLEKPPKLAPEEEKGVGLEFEVKEKIELEEPGVKEVEAKLAEEIKVAPAPVVPVAPSLPRLVKDPHLVEIEQILEEDLKNTFLDLSPEKQRKFKAEGERVAGIIWQMIETAKLQVNKVIKLIRRWLKIIPGINRFFLEQETKIKTDKIVELARKHRR